MTDNQLHIGILIIGDEILTGHRRDKHFAKTIDILHDRGLELSWARYAGDDETLLVQHFREIKNLGHCCFSFGGIGATIDDRTRQAIAAAFEQALIRHPEAVKEIEAQFGDQSYPNRILMADLPDGAEIIPNPYNRIPGFSMGEIHCLPGFPEMAWPMMEWVLGNKYPQLTTTATVRHSLVLHDVHESELITLLADFQKNHPEVKVSSLPTFLDDGHYQIELGVKGMTAEAESAFKALKQKLTEQGLL